MCIGARSRLVRSLILILTVTVAAYSQNGTWERTSGPFGGTILALAASASGVLLAEADGSGPQRIPFLSTDLGDTWSPITLLPGMKYTGPVFTDPRGDLLAVTTDDSSHYGFSRSSDGGGTWKFVRTDFAVRALIRDTSGALLVSANPGGIMRSTDDGMSWTSSNFGLSYANAATMATDQDGRIYAGIEGFNGQGMGVYRSTDNGSSWTQVLNYNYAYTRALLVTPGGSVILGTAGGGVFRSTDAGLSWRSENNGLQNLRVSSLAQDSTGTILIGTASGAFRSTNDGQTWNRAIHGLTSLDILSLVHCGHRTFVAGTFGSAFRSTDAGDSWKECIGGLVSTLVLSLTADSSGTLFAATQGMSRVCRSTDRGYTWTTVNNGLDSVYVSTLIVDSADHLFAGTGTGIYRSTDRGDSWAPVNDGLINRDVRCFALGPNGRMYAGTFAGNDGKGIFRSIDGGMSWDALNTAFSNEAVQALGVDSAGNLFAGMSTAGILRSTDDGQSWFEFSNDNLPYASVQSLIIDSAGRMYAAIGIFGVYTSFDDGQHWITNAITQVRGISCFTGGPGGTIYGGGLGVYKLHFESGYAFRLTSIGLDTVSVRALQSSRDGFLYAGLYGGGVWRSRLSDNVQTAAAPLLQGIPLEFSLSQNYPNPFNPSTTIRFSIPILGFTVMKVYDLLGREVAVLVNEKKEPGSYTVRFDASGLASGVYFYKIQAGEFVKTRTLLVLR
jgi:photosystem II stability/assembly factor-like uncharacterized protein